MDDPPAAGALYIAGPDGSDNTMIGRRWEYTVPFGWSPDGSRIAYVTGTDSPDSRALYTNTRDGSDERRVSELAELVSPI